MKAVLIAAVLLWLVAAVVLANAMSTEAKCPADRSARQTVTGVWVCIPSFDSEVSH